MGELSDLMASILAANIKALRLKTSPNQTEFGELFNVSQGTVARWENGTQPKAKHLIELAELAGTSPHTFMTRLLAEIGENLPAPEPRDGFIYLPVWLPNEASLTIMFEQLLEIVESESDPRAVARRLAQLLPTALARTAAHSPVGPDPAAGQGAGDPPGENAHL